MKALLLGALVLCTGLLAIPATADPGHDAFTITTQNVRVGMSRPHSQHDISQAAEFSSVLITQEMDRRAAGSYAPEGWGWAHFGHGGDRGDCATFFDRSVWRKLRAWVTPISFEPFRHGHRWALTVVLKNRATTDRLAVVCVHMFTQTELRNAAFGRAAGHIRDLIERLRTQTTIPYVVVGGDWNRIWDHRARFRGFASVKPNRPTTSGRIDYFYWTRQTLGQTGHRVIGPTFSDHDGFRVHLEGSVF